MHGSRAVLALQKSLQVHNHIHAVTAEKKIACETTVKPCHSCLIPSAVTSIALCIPANACQQLTPSSGSVNTHDSQDHLPKGVLQRNAGWLRWAEPERCTWIHLCLWRVCVLEAARTLLLQLALGRPQSHPCLNIFQPYGCSSWLVQRTTHVDFAVCILTGWLPQNFSSYATRA